MSNPYVGEIRLFGGSFAPAGWALCQGQLVSIAENEVLFTLIGTTYGGDGQETFGLPDLRGRVPLHQGNGPGLSPRVIGERAGAETVTLSTQQLPAHSHTLVATTATASATAGPAAGVLATASVKLYGTGAPGTTLANAAIAPASGGNQPHENMAPFLAIHYIISLYGIFPSQS